MGYARRRADDEMAREVVAETFAVTWRRLDDVPADPLPWLLGVARRVLANQRRGDRRRRALHDRLLALPPERVPDPADRAGEAEALRAAFATLSEDDRDTLALAAWEGLAPAQAARVAGCSARAFSARLSRARSRLEKAMAAAAANPAASTAAPGEMT